ncbi:MAG TPA: glycosyltransferase family A protein [Kineosporiaceae bacterium]
MQKVLSVVIAAYNAADTLGTQLKALVGQAPGLGWEVVVADNRSTDATAAIAESFADRLDLRVVPAPAKANAAYARNVAVATCEAGWIAFVDADDMVAPGWVESMAHGLREHQFVAGRLDSGHLNTPAIVRTRPVPQSTGLQWWSVGPPLPHAGGGNLGIHRSVFEAVGGFDENLGGLQDVDFCWRVQLAGVPLHFLPEATLHVGLRSSLPAMWRQGRNYGAAQAEIERRYAAVTAADIPPEVRVERPASTRSPGGRTRTLLAMLANVPHPGALAWQVAWSVGHRLGHPTERRRTLASAAAELSRGVASLRR